VNVGGITWHAVKLDPGIEAAGGELLSEIHRVPEMRYAYRHFRGPDGQVYGLNEQK
jgi:hypothetical protein